METTVDLLGALCFFVPPVITATCVASNGLLGYLLSLVSQNAATRENPSLVISILRVMLNFLARAPKEVARALMKDRCAGEGLTVHFNIAAKSVLPKHLADTTVGPYVSTAAGKQRNPWHIVWCLLLDLMTLSVAELGHAERLLEDVLEFVANHMPVFEMAVSQCVVLFETRFYSIKSPDPQSFPRKKQHGAGGRERLGFGPFRSIVFFRR